MAGDRSERWEYGRLLFCAYYVAGTGPEVESFYVVVTAESPVVTVEQDYDLMRFTARINELGVEGWRVGWPSVKASVKDYGVPWLLPLVEKAAGGPRPNIEQFEMYFLRRRVS